MRAAVKPFLASVLLLLASSPAYFGHARDHASLSQNGQLGPCQAQVTYRIGTLDPRFRITREEFWRAIEDASGVWAADQKPFRYDPKGTLRINLVYDSRQEITQRVITMRTAISAKTKEADLIEDRILPLKYNFRALEDSYSDRLASFERAQDSYNQDVKHWNSLGGAPEAELQNLAIQKLSLRKQHALLEEKRLALNHATDEINELVKRHNALLTRASAEASALNNSGSTGVQFEEGRYVRESGEERIDIFQFESKAGLLVILAHELGHALGMEHNANPSSIMSPLIHTDRLALTVEDEDGLKAVCARH